MVGVVTRIEYDWAAPAKERVRVMLRWWHGIVLQPQVPYFYVIFFLNTFSDCAAREFRCNCRLGRGASGDEARRGSGRARSGTGTRGTGHGD